MGRYTPCTLFHSPYLYGRRNISLCLVSKIRHIIRSCHNCYSLASNQRGNHKSIFFVSYNSGSTISTLLLYVVWKSPPCVIHLTGLVVFFHNLCVFFPSTIEELAPQSSRILSDLNLALPRLQFISPHSTGA